MADNFEAARRMLQETVDLWDHGPRVIVDYVSASGEMETKAAPFRSGDAVLDVPAGATVVRTRIDVRHGVTVKLVASDAR